MHINPIRYNQGLSPRFSHISFTENKELSSKIAVIPSENPTDIQNSTLEKLDVSPSDTTVKKFKNGETYVCINEPVRGKEVYLMPSSSQNVNDRLQETYLKADAAKRAGAKHVYAILPDFPYARQERRSKTGEPVSAKLVMDMLKTSGVDGIITVDLHAPAIEGFADNSTKIENLSSFSVVAEDIKQKNIENPVVVSPDNGGIKRAETLAKELNCPSAVIYKQRKEHNVAEAKILIGDVKDKNCIIFDDIIDTAGTIAAAAKMLKENGANDIYIYATHGLFNGDAYEKLQNSPVTEVTVTNTVPLKPGAPDKISQIDASSAIKGAILDFTA